MTVADTLRAARGHIEWLQDWAEAELRSGRSDRALRLSDIAETLKQLLKERERDSA